MLGGQKSFLKRKRLGMCIFSAIILASLFVCFYEPSSPDGVYFDEYLACGHGRFIFKEGKIFVQCDMEPPQIAGLYEKLGGQWVSGNASTNRTVIKPSLFGVKLTGSSWQHGEVFFPRDEFSWVIDWREWIHLHLFP